MHDIFRAFAPTRARAERPRAPRGRMGGPSFFSSALPGKLSLLPTATTMLATSKPIKGCDVPVSLLPYK